MGPDHLWSTSWSGVVARAQLWAPPTCSPQKIPFFDTHMYKLDLGTPTDQLWSTSWSGVVARVQLWAPPTYSPRKMPLFDIHMYELDLGPPTDQLWSTSWSGVVACQIFLALPQEQILSFNLVLKFLSWLYRKYPKTSVLCWVLKSTN